MFLIFQFPFLAFLGYGRFFRFTIWSYSLYTSRILFLYDCTSIVNNFFTNRLCFIFLDYLTFVGLNNLILLFLMVFSFSCDFETILFCVWGFYIFIDLIIWICFDFGWGYKFFWLDGERFILVMNKKMCDISSTYIFIIFYGILLMIFYKVMKAVKLILILKFRIKVDIDMFIGETKNSPFLRLIF